MKNLTHRHTLLDIPLVEERYGRSFVVSIALHIGAVLIMLLSPYWFHVEAMQIGTGPGGGVGGETYAVGVVDELAGGTGMTKPSLTPQPPALVAPKPAREEPKEKAVPLPETLEPKRAKAKLDKTAAEAKTVPPKAGNVIPTAPEPGAGGTGGMTGGSGGGLGGGVGVSIGSGTGGVGDSWYARSVEGRISSNWLHPPEGVHVDIVYSFYIAANGSIYDIQKEKSSGNIELDLAAFRAIRASHPLTPPPPEFQGRPVQFVAHFLYPPNP